MRNKDDYCLIYVTTSSVEEARTIARLVVERRLAACSNILHEMESLYWWNGKLETGDECVLLFKTRRSLADAVADMVKAEHSYECPCVLVVPINGGNTDFLTWMDAETVPQPPG